MVLVERLIRLAIGYRRRHRHDETEILPVRKDRRAERTRARQDRRAARRQRTLQPPEEEKTWLEERIGPATWTAVSDPPELGNVSLAPETPPAPVNAPRHQAQPSLPPDVPTASKPLPVVTPLPLRPLPAPLSSYGEIPGNNGSPKSQALTDRTSLAPDPGPGDIQEDARRIAGSLRMIQRLHDEGALATEWSISDATLIYWAVTSNAFHDALDSVGMNNEEYTRATTKLLQRGLTGWHTEPIERT